MCIVHAMEYASTQSVRVRIVHMKCNLMPQVTAVC